VGNVSVSRDGGEYRPARSDSLLHLLWPAIEAEYARAFDGWACDDEVGEDDVFIEPVRKTLAAPWQLPPPKSLPGSLMPLDTTDTDEEVEFYWVGTDARIAGTIVHRWLQVLAEGRGSLDGDEIEAERKVTRRWLREMGLGDDMQRSIVERVEAALDGVRGDEKGRWILEGDGHAELALTGQFDGSIESVVLDRVRIDERGIHWIIDYKTSAHEGGNLQGFLNAEVERYKPQLDKYAAIYGAFAGTRPRCALYFPLLQEFVEV
jgi:hypothetical protein